MSENIVKKIKRSLLAHFLDTTPGTSATWTQIRKATSLTINMNAQTEDEQYIDEDVGSTTVTGYKPSASVPLTCHSDDPLFVFIDDIRRGNKVLADAQTYLLTVYKYDDDSAGAYPADKQLVDIQIDDFGGDAGGSLKLNYTLNYNGEPVQGTFNPTTKTFTESA